MLTLGLDGDRDPAVLDAVPASHLQFEDERSERIIVSTFEAAQRGIDPVAWAAEIGSPGCPRLFVPGIVVGCAAGDVQPGPAWVATRPLALVGEGSDARILVASGMAWSTDGALPMLPDPSAGGVDGRWRWGASAPFTLAELRAADATYFQQFPVPSASLERTTSPEATINVPGFTGTRVFVRAIAGAADGSPIGEAHIDRTLTAAEADLEQRTVHRIDVPPGLDAGRDGASTEVGLADVPTPDGSRADRWSVTVVAINDWGEVGEPRRELVTRDSIGPTLAMDSPFLSAVWPLPAAIEGVSEPGVKVVVEGVGPVELDRRGNFTVRTPLAPWPQTLTATATDASGNVTTREVSVIGGIDYRRLPWGTIGAIALIAAVTVSGFIGSRRAAASDRSVPGGPRPVASGWDDVGGRRSRNCRPVRACRPCRLGRRPSGRGRGASRRAGGPSCRVPRRAAARRAAAVTGVQPARPGGRGRRCGGVDRDRCRSRRAAVATAGAVCDGRSRIGAHRGSRLRRRCPRPGREQDLAGRRPRRRDAAPTAERPDPAAGGRELAPSHADSPQGDVERPQEQGEDEQERPQVGRQVGGGQVVDPRILGQRDDRAAGRRPQRGQVRLVGTQEAVLRGGRGDQADGPAQRRRPGLRLGHPDGVRPGIDLPEAGRVHAGSDLDELDVGRLQGRTDDDGGRGVEVARRTIGLDALDPQRGLAAGRLEGRLDATGLLAREGPRHELAEELREPVPGQPVARPAPGRVGRPGDRPAEAVLPLGEERVVARRDQDRLGGRLGGRPVVAAQPRQAVVLDAPQDRRLGRLDREERLLDDLLAGDLLGLLEEDVRDAARVRRVVEAPTAIGCETLQERVRRRRRRRPSRG